MLNELVSYFVGRYFLPTIFTAHPIFFSVLLQTTAATLLMTIALAVYLFKKKAKIAYGVSEVALAVIANLALISHLDLSLFLKDI